MNGGGAQLTEVTINKHTHTNTPQCPLSYYAQERLRPSPQAQICSPINILYVDTCSLKASDESYFQFMAVRLHRGNAKTDFRSVSRDKVWNERKECKMRGRKRHCWCVCTKANNM